MTALRFENLELQDKTQFKPKVIDFWRRLNVLPPEVNAEERFEEVLFAVMQDDQLVGVSTYYPLEVPQLKCWMYGFRCLVSPELRQQHVASNLLKGTKDYLNEKAQGNPSEKCKGVYVEVENAHINQFRRQLVWPNTGFVYIGQTPHGFQQRVSYFDGAHLD